MPVNSALTGRSSTPSLGRLERFCLVWKAKILLLAGARQSAAEVFQGILRRAPHDVLALNSLAYDALQRGEHALAHRYFEQALTLNARVSNAHFNLAFVAELLGRLDEAEQGFRAALAIEEKMDRAWYGLGLVLVRQGRLTEALVALRRNTQLQPMSPFGWYQLARVHVDLQQPEQAKAVIAHLKGFEPKVAAQLERETGLRPA